MTGSRRVHFDVGSRKKLWERKFGPDARMSLSNYANECLFEERLLVEPGSELRHKAGSITIWLMSVIAMRNLRVDVSGSNTICRPSVERSNAIASRIGLIISSAYGVASMPRDVLTNNGSLKCLRNLASPMLTEGCVTPMFAAALDTLPVL